MKFAVMALIGGASAKYHLRHAEKLFSMNITNEAKNTIEDKWEDLGAAEANLGGMQGAGQFQDKVAEHVQALEESQEVADLMTWSIENMNSTNWDDATKEAVATYQAKLATMEDTAEALAAGYHDELHEATEDVGHHRTVYLEDDQWEAFNEATEAVKDFEVNTLKDLPLVKNWRQHVLNVRYSKEFKKLEGDYKTAMNNTQVQALVTDYGEFVTAIKEAPQMTDETKEMLEGSFVVKEVFQDIDMVLESMKTGNLEPVIDYLVNGETDGSLKAKVDGATVEQSEGAKNASAAEKATGLVASIATAMVAFAATQF